MTRRLLQAADEAAIYEIVVDPSVNPYMDFERISAAEFRPIFQSMLSAGSYMVAVAEGRVIGLYSLTRFLNRAAHVAYFGTFALHPAWQGRGFGRQIMMLVIDDVRALGLKRLELAVESDNRRAIALYERLGFAREGVLQRRVHRAGEAQAVDQILMAIFL